MSAAAGTGVDGGEIGESGARVNPDLTDGFGAAVITWSSQTTLGTDPSVAQGHPMSKMKFSLSKTG